MLQPAATRPVILTSFLLPQSLDTLPVGRGLPPVGVRVRVCGARRLLAAAARLRARCPLRLRLLPLSPAMDRSLTRVLAKLARDGCVMVRSDCRVRTHSRAELVALVGLHARLHLIG